MGRDFSDSRGLGLGWVQQLVDWVGLGPDFKIFRGLDWVGSRKMDPRTTLVKTVFFSSRPWTAVNEHIDLRYDEIRLCGPVLE